MEAKAETREPRKRYEEAFKRDCVALLATSGKGLRAFAAEMGLNHWNLRDWRRLYRTPAPGKREPAGVEGRLKKSLGHPCRTPAERYARMKAMEHEHAMTELCEAFAVSRSGYCRWRGAVPGERAREDARITEVLCAAHRRSRETYGRPRLVRELRAQGLRHSQRRIHRLMRPAQLRGVQRGRFQPQTTDSGHGREAAANWLGKMPMPSAPNQVWVADITHVWTEEG
jgi:putative transposase